MLLLLATTTLLLVGTSVSQNEGDPLMLTPLLTATPPKIAEAKEKATAKFGSVGYSGYITVTTAAPACNNHLFFWFTPAMNSPETSPLVMWLEGGPGLTSMKDLFEDNGPFYYSKDLKLKKRKNAWTDDHSMIFVDNPVGTGYSFSDTAGVTCFAPSQDVISAGLMEFTRQFFVMFPEYRPRDFFIGGVSYGAKYAVSTAVRIRAANAARPAPPFQINLKGLIIGNGLVDPETTLSHAPYLYQLGMLDTTQRDEAAQIETDALAAIQATAPDYAEATRLINELMFNDDSYFKTNTGFMNGNNFNNSVPLESVYGNFLEFITKPNTRRKIHVGKTPFGDSAQMEAVKTALGDDLARSVKDGVIALLNGAGPLATRFLFYNGQYDILIPYPVTVAFIRSMATWNNLAAYNAAARSIWRVGTEVAGYVKSVNNEQLVEVLVRQAGHFAAGDKLEWTHEMITKFTRSQPIA